MSDTDFFDLAFGNLGLLLSCMVFVMALFYFCIRGKAVAGYLDPVHFYWTFTMGSAYGVVLFMYVSGKLETYLLLILFSYCSMFMIVYSICHGRALWFPKMVRLFLVPEGKGRSEFIVVVILYSLLALFLIINVGFGSSAETNRFEQNRGFGAFVRVADGFRLFIISYLTLWIGRRFRSKNVNFVTVLMIGGLFLDILISSFLNGAKFAILESIYAVILVLFFAKFSVRVGFTKLFLLGVTVLLFAGYILTRNLENSGVDVSERGVYMPNSSVLVERLVLRVFANADKYYFALPGNVIERLETDSFFLQMLSPLVGVTTLSNAVGHPVNDYTVGRQSLLYWYPTFDVAGGPTSHYDLFAYKYLGYAGGLLFVMMLSFVLSSISTMSRVAGSDFYYALAATLWLRALPMLLEPAIGLSYILDIFILFFVIKVFGMILRAFSQRGMVSV